MLSKVYWGSLDRSTSKSVHSWHTFAADLRRKECFRNKTGVACGSQKQTQKFQKAVLVLRRSFLFVSQVSLHKSGLIDKLTYKFVFFWKMEFCIQLKTLKCKTKDENLVVNFKIYTKIKAWISTFNHLLFHLSSQ